MIRTTLVAVANRKSPPPWRNADALPSMKSDRLLPVNAEPAPNVNWPDMVNVLTRLL